MFVDDVPRRFRTSSSDGDGRWVEIEEREVLDHGRVSAAMEPALAVDWSALRHAGGPASDVLAYLYGVVAGRGWVRREAWWELRGTILFQGMVFSATAPALPTLRAVARWPAHPDRSQALRFLRHVCRASGARGDDPVALLAAVRAEVLDHADALVAGWRGDVPIVQRAKLWLLTADPALAARHAELVAAALPGELAAAWGWALHEPPDGQQAFDALCALEEWVRTGAVADWYVPPPPDG